MHVLKLNIAEAERVKEWAKAWVVIASEEELQAMPVVAVMTVIQVAVVVQTMVQVARVVSV